MDKSRLEVESTAIRQGKILGTGRMRNVLVISVCGAIVLLAVVYLFFAA